MLILKEESKLTNSAACYLALEVMPQHGYFQDNREIVPVVFICCSIRLQKKDLVKDCFGEICLKVCTFQGTGSIKIRRFSSPSAATMVPPRVVTTSFAHPVIQI